MNITAHINALHDKHAYLETCLLDEQSRPMPDFATISLLKKRKLRLKEELDHLQSALPKAAHA